MEIAEEGWIHKVGQQLFTLLLLNE